jgi:hypothetical protein
VQTRVHPLAFAPRRRGPLFCRGRPPAGLAAGLRGGGGAARDSSSHCTSLSRCPRRGGGKGGLGAGAGLLLSLWLCTGKGKTKRPPIARRRSSIITHVAVRNAVLVGSSDSVWCVWSEGRNSPQTMLRLPDSEPFDMGHGGLRLSFHQYRSTRTPTRIQLGVESAVHAPRVCKGQELGPVFLSLHRTTGSMHPPTHYPCLA